MNTIGASMNPLRTVSVSSSVRTSLDRLHPRKGWCGSGGCGPRWWNGACTRVGGEVGVDCDEGVPYAVSCPCLVQTDVSESSTVNLTYRYRQWSTGGYCQVTLLVGVKFYFFESHWSTVGTLTRYGEWRTRVGGDLLGESDRRNVTQENSGRRK